MPTTTQPENLLAWQNLIAAGIGACIALLGTFVKGRQDRRHVKYERYTAKQDKAISAIDSVLCDLDEKFYDMGTHYLYLNSIITPPLRSSKEDIDKVSQGIMKDRVRLSNLIARNRLYLPEKTLELLKDYNFKAGVGTMMHRQNAFAILTGEPSKEKFENAREAIVLIRKTLEKDFKENLQ